MDHYEVLGISKEATFDEIKAAYHTLARKYHPDVNKNFDAADLLDVIIDKDDARKANQRSADELLAKRRRQIDARNQK